MSAGEYVAGPASGSAPRVAIVHERFSELGGSERVVEQMFRIWPKAQVFAPILDRRTLPDGLVDAPITTSALQRVFRGHSSYKFMLPLLAGAMARFDLAGFDLVLTSHHAFANRVRPPVGVPIISYTHTPARWMWQPDMRSSEWGGRAAQTALGAYAATQRRPDRAAAQRLRGVVANSRFVATRVERWWGRRATVVPPPVDTEHYVHDTSVERDDFFLLAGRLVPYKQPTVAIEAARNAGVRLVVAGDGRAREACEDLAGPHTEFLGRVDDDALRDLYQRCRALVFPGVEDFGIIPLEAAACGTPVIAPAVGGVLDTIVDAKTGVLYEPHGDHVDRVTTLTSALKAFDDASFDAATIRTHAEQFAAAKFRERFAHAVETMLTNGPTGPLSCSPGVGERAE